MFKLINKHKYLFIFLFILICFFIFNNNVFAIDGGEPSQSIYNDLNTALTNMSSYFNVDFINDWSNWNYQFGTFNGGYSLCVYNNGWGYVPNDNGSYAWTGSRPYNIYLYQIDNNFNIIYTSKVENGSTARFGGAMNTLTFYYSNLTYSGVFNTRFFVPSSLAFNEPYFHLEYENENDYPIVYSKWYDFIDSTKESGDIYKETILANKHYYGVEDSKYSYTWFSNSSRDILGWKSFEGDENTNGPGYQENYEDYTDFPNDLQWRVGYQITNYGVYYFCHYNVEDDTYNIERLTINPNNAYFESYDSNNDSYKTTETYNASEISNIITNASAYDNLSLRVEQNNNIGSIFTNWINWNNGYKYEFYWSTDNLNWNGDFPYEENSNGYRRYILDVTQNGIYYIKMRIFDSNNNFIKDVVESATISSLGSYNSYNSIDSMINNNSVYNFFKNNLGILFYPIDLMFQFIQRLMTITESEPNIVVPTITEVFTGRTLIQGFTFSLNDILSNPGVASAYNIYLYFADFIVYGWFIRFLYKVCKEFMNISGGVV